MHLSGRLLWLCTAVALPVFGQEAPVPEALPPALEPAQQLVRDVVFNELHDRERDSHWEYRSESSSTAGTSVRDQVETADGPIFRVLSMDGAPLDADQQQREDQRIEEYVHDPAQIARVARAHQEDEDRLGSAIGLLPQAALFAYADSPENDVVHLAFRPNPDFVPSGIEARIVHALSGTITVNVRSKRMIEMRGVVAERVDFGYGLLGQVEKGGWFAIHRTQVSEAHWKTDLVDLHIQGKILLLKSLAKVQREARSDFRPVPNDTSLAEAMEMLRENAGAVQAKLTSTAAGMTRPGAKD